MAMRLRVGKKRDLNGAAASRFMRPVGIYVSSGGLEEVCVQTQGGSKILCSGNSKVYIPSHKGAATLIAPENLLF